MLLERIQLTNLLSFGPQTEEFELRPLNVLIGANGSGKSNFVEAIGLLQAAPVDLDGRVRVGRGVAGSGKANRRPMPRGWMRSCAQAE